MPSDVAFAFSQFPNNLPLPQPRKLAVIIGTSMHILHFSVRIFQMSQVPSSSLGWEDMYQEDESSWFDWVGNCQPVSSTLLTFHSRTDTTRLDPSHPHFHWECISSVYPYTNLPTQPRPRPRRVSSRQVRLTRIHTSKRSLKPLFFLTLFAHSTRHQNHQTCLARFHDLSQLPPEYDAAERQTNYKGW